MNYEIIKLYDENNYVYPLIEIKATYLEQFEKDLKEYKKNEDYNIDGFIELLEFKEYFIRTIYEDYEVYF